MANVFIKQGGNYRIAKKENLITYDHLPAATYTIKFDEQQGDFYLETIEDFKLPEKIYGSNTNHSHRILTTFGKREGSTGVLLSGIKGAGKTLLAKQLAVHGREIGYPTIVINHPWHGEQFNSFIQRIDTSAIIIFDEFEKTYHDWKHQQALLTLLDGVYPTKKLFVLTTNSFYNINEYFRNRPGRIFYNLKFETLEEDFIREYCEDNLNDQTGTADILRYTKIYTFFNFDMLAAVVEEMNRYKETLAQVLQVLNITPEVKESESYKLILEHGTDTVVLNSHYNRFDANNFNYDIYLDYEYKWREENSPIDKALKEINEIDEYGDSVLKFTHKMISDFDHMTGSFIIQNGDFKLRLEKNKKETYTRFSPLDF